MGGRRLRGCGTGFPPRVPGGRRASRGACALGRARGKRDGNPTTHSHTLTCTPLRQAALEFFDDPGGGMVPGPETLLVDPKDHAGVFS